MLVFKKNHFDDFFSISLFIFLLYSLVALSKTFIRLKLAYCFDCYDLKYL